MLLRKVDERVFQSDFSYALAHSSEYGTIISVAKDCKHPRASLWIEQSDLEYIPKERYHMVYNFIVSRGDNGNVLIHCCSGISRSVAYSIAYLVLKYGITVVEAKKRLNVFYALHPDIERSLNEVTL